MNGSTDGRDPGPVPAYAATRARSAEAMNKDLKRARRDTAALRAALVWTWSIVLAWSVVTTLIVIFGWVLWVQAVDLVVFVFTLVAWRKTVGAWRS